MLVKTGMNDAAISKYSVGAYKIPTSSPEADGTLEWDSTTLVVVSITAADTHGVGYTYADKATAILIEDLLKAKVVGQNAICTSKIWEQMVRHIRNLGHPGIASMAISGIDAALWDLKSKLLKLPLVTLLGQVRKSIDVYGSGGFTNYSETELCRQLSGWTEQGIKSVKMKVGTHPEQDVGRVEAARKAIAPHSALFVDANGAYGQREAHQKAFEFSNFGVSWFEEPVPAHDFEGIKFVREHAPEGMKIASGEYGYELDYFRRLLESKAVDFLQADVTRCGGFTGFQKVAVLAESFGIPLSSHCAPTLHIALACSIPVFKYLEYFHDHVRIEKMFFDGWEAPTDGQLRPDLTRLGLGIEFKHRDAEKFKT